MNKLNRLLAYFMLASVLFAGIACDDDDDDDDDPTPGVTVDPKWEAAGLTATTQEINGTTYTVISGTVTSDLTIAASDNVILNDGLFVGEDGVSSATLNIQAGARIYAADNDLNTFLAISRGSQINATGTAANPIIMTSIREITSPSTLDRGLWGGIIINGNTTTNAGGNVAAEGNAGSYGDGDGTSTTHLNPNDDSGTMTYVVCKYAGKLITTGDELNTFAFNGVGTAGTFEYLQAYAGNDDGFEFFGGLARVKYAVSTECRDDAFDWTDGWAGFGQFWAVEHAGGFSTTNDEGGQDINDNGIEADNVENDADRMPISNPKLSNLTFVGTSNSARGIRLRRGTGCIVHASLVTGFGNTGLVIGDESAPRINGGDETDATIVVQYSHFWNNGAEGTTNTDSNAAEFEDNASTYNNGFADPSAGLDGIVGVPSATAADPNAEIDSWFTSTTQIGAISSSNNWAAGWVFRPDGTTTY